MSIKTLIVFIFTSFLMISCNGDENTPGNVNENGTGGEQENVNPPATTHSGPVYFKNAVFNEANLRVQWLDKSVDLKPNECLQVPASDIQSAIDRSAFRLSTNFLFVLGKRLCSVSVGGQGNKKFNSQSGIDCRQVQNFVITSIEKMGMDDYERSSTELSDTDKANCKMYADYQAKSE